MRLSRLRVHVLVESGPNVAWERPTGCCYRMTRSPLPECCFSWSRRLEMPKLGWIAVGLFSWVGLLAAAVRRLGKPSAKSQA